MNTIILCIGALIATLVAWVYLSVQENTVKELPEVQEDADNRAAARKEEPAGETEHHSLVQRPKGKRLAFLIVMFLALCAVAVALSWVYPSNSLIDNGKLLVLLALLFVAASVDARQRIIPNAVVLTGLVLRVVFWIMELVTAPSLFWNIMKNDLLACLLVVGFFVVGVLLVKGGIGMGDIKLMLVMCLFQGFYGVVSSLFCSLFVAFVYAIVVLLARKKTRKDSVAFAPAILLGTILSIVLTGM